MKILITDGLSKEGLDILREEKDMELDVRDKVAQDELKRIIKDYEGLIIRSATKVTREIINNAERLKVLGRAGVGLDNVDVDSASKRGIIVMNTPEGNTISTAEHTFSMLLALSRNIPQANLSVKNNEWERKKFTGVEVFRKTLGIIGLGRVGGEVAKRAISFGMKVIAYDPFLSMEKAEKLEVELADLKDLLSRSDYISVHTPLIDDTRHLISKNEFKIMKDGVRIINCARGGIIDEAALFDAIKSKKVAGAALDVFETEPPVDNRLMELDCVITTPHLGASTEEAQVNVAIDIAKQVRDALKGRGIRNAVNIPSVTPEVFKVIEPYVKLAEKIGSLQSQMASGRISQVKVNYGGEVTNHELAPITIALIKGLLTPVLGETVNYVNASFIAKERGIEVRETRTTDVEDFTNLISVEVRTDKMSNSISGTLFTKNTPRIVRIDNFYVHAVPEGYMIITFNLDKPGIIGGIGTILGKNNINIAGMTFGREESTGQAITVLNVDSPVSQDVLDQVKGLPNISDAKLIKL
ncbi:MAG: phosphoglycerate dehydrogenase [Candidatus Omnitrophica bacterium]|nr:phosphoglycerate dehydrogenase [Candidatus Omnitrophota bacterium]